MAQLRRLTVAAAALAVLARLWWRASPSPWPYAWRHGLYAPWPAHRIPCLLALLAPRSGESLLEIGPGVGQHALVVAERLLPDGTLDVLDVQQVMLDHVARRARRRGLANIRPLRADARRLPYPDASFDGAFLITALGEISDLDEALRELRRVLRPNGRLVVGEFLLNPHGVRLGKLKRHVAAAGLHYDGHTGTALCYLARLAPSPRDETRRRAREQVGRKPRTETSGETAAARPSGGIMA